MSGFGIISVVGTGVGINTIYTIQHNGDPFPVLFAGSLWIGACVMIAEGNANVGIALAWVYLIGVIVSRGPALFNTLNEMVGNS